jgi:hypothetical protein
MMNIIRLIAATALLLLSMSPFASDTQAQLCHTSFAYYEVVDSVGKNISDVTIELVGEVSGKDYIALRTEFIKKEVYGPNFKLFPQDVEQIVKRSVPMRITRDTCENPLKQRANSTKVKTMYRGKASKKNFGFCNVVGHYREPLLLKISAPGYVTDYYVGQFLSDCRTHERFVLSKDEKIMRNQK